MVWTEYLCNTLFPISPWEQTLDRRDVIANNRLGIQVHIKCTKLGPDVGTWAPSVDTFDTLGKLPKLGDRARCRLPLPELPLTKLSLGPH